jgi:hypothetical protein
MADYSRFHGGSMFCILRWEWISSITIFATDATISSVNNYLGLLIRCDVLSNFDGFSLSRSNFCGPLITRTPYRPTILMLYHMLILAHLILP